MGLWSIYLSISLIETIVLLLSLLFAILATGNGDIGVYSMRGEPIGVFKAHQYPIYDMCWLKGKEYFFGWMMIIILSILVLTYRYTLLSSPNIQHLPSNVERILCTSSNNIVKFWVLSNSNKDQKPTDGSHTTTPLNVQCINILDSNPYEGNCNQYSLSFYLSIFLF